MYVTAICTMTIKRVLLLKRPGVSILRFFQPDMVAQLYSQLSRGRDGCISEFEPSVSTG